MLLFSWFDVKFFLIPNQPNKNTAVLRGKLTIHLCIYLLQVTVNEDEQIYINE
nr:MAG TPA: hypothetical protein [Caudoviricetes sp.]